MKNKENDKKQSILHILKNNLMMVKKVFKYSPQLVLLIIGAGVIGGACNSLNTVLMALIMKKLEEGASFPEFLPLFLMMTVATFVNIGYGRARYLYIQPWMAQRLHYRMHAEIFEKAMKADLACFDDPEFYNSYVWAMNESDGRARQTVDKIADLISYSIYAVTSFALVFTVSPVIVVLGLFRSVLFLWLERKINRIHLEQREQSTPLDRKCDYINRVFYLADFAKELRSSRIGKRLLEQYDEAEDALLNLHFHFGKKLYLLRIPKSIITTATEAASLVIAIVGLYNGSIGIAGFTIIVSQMWSLMWSLQNFGYYFSELENNSLFIEKYRSFMSYIPKVQSGSLPVGDFESLTLENVSFRYTEKGEAVLKNVSMTIKKGEKIAIVGYNGAGKTTLIKLLMRFYDPTEGRILLNGIDIKEYDLKEYRSAIGAVFQDFKLFSATIAENVLGRPLKGEEERETVLEALKKAQFAEKAESLEKGIDTMVTKEFDDEGMNFSGGESQKIAIARVFAREYDLVIMDEPSSALDPIAEYNLNHAVSAHLDGQTVIFISHRLSTTKMTDRIYFFAKGELLECGSHDALLEVGGGYAEMFRVQAKKYQTK